MRSQGFPKITGISLALTEPHFPRESEDLYFQDPLGNKGSIRHLQMRFDRILKNQLLPIFLGEPNYDWFEAPYRKACRKRISLDYIRVLRDFT